MQKSLYYQFIGFLQTPSLWKNGELFNLEQFNTPQIKLSPFHDFKNVLPELDTQYVMGKRMEIFFKEFISLSLTYKILASNLQIFRKKVTLGEIDFILQDLPSLQIIHLELVYKFYIYDPSIPNEIDRWIGPNRKDTLQQKINKLKSKQFPLLEVDETRLALESYQIDTSKIEQKVCFKAKLFVPKKMLENTFPFINNECIEGYYLKIKEFESKEYSTSLYFMPSKRNWPVHPKHNDQWYSYSEIQEELSRSLEKNKSPLIWRKISEDTWESFFLVWW